MDIGALLGSAASGGVLGGVFSLGNAAVQFMGDRAKAKETLETTAQQFTHDIDLAKLTQANANQQASNAVVQTKLEGIVTEMQKSFDGLTASMTDQTTLDGKQDGIVLDVLSLFRPGLTLTLILAAVTLGCLHQDALSGQLVELSSMAVAWWFGDRQRMKYTGAQ